MRAHRLVGLALGLGVGLAGVADADVEDPMVLPPTAIHATLDGTQAKLVARFAHRVAGTEQTALMLSRPWGAVITGASITVEGETHRLALVRKDAADAAFDAIHEAAPGSARRWGVVIADAGMMPSATFLAPHAAWATIDLELSMPTCFFNDTRYALVPADWEKAFDVALRNRPISDAAIIACRGMRGRGDDAGMLALPSKELASRPPGEPRLGVTAGRLPLQTTHFARVELDLAGTLSAVPPDLATAIVIDGSRSVDGDDLEAERRVVASYLRHAPSSRVQVIAYARGAHAILPAWSLASRAAPRVDREIRALVTRNGSNLDVGLAEAATWLNRVEGTRRVILFTDERLAEAVAKLPASTLVSLLPPHTLVHVVAIDGQADALERGETMFADVATATEGIAVRGGIRDGGTGDAELLARPISLDDVTIDAPGWTDDGGGTCPSDEAGLALREGHACTWWWSGTAVSGPITVGGRMWGHPLSRIVHPDPTRAVALARERQPRSAFEGAIAEQLMDAAHAVNGRWSLFGSWGGRGGYNDLAEGGGIGLGSICGCDTAGTLGRGGGTGTLKLNPFSLESQLRNGLRACNVRHDRVEVTVETTLQEIVALDVKVVEGLGFDQSPTSQTTKQACAEEALWNVSLALQDPPFHATTELVIGPAGY